MKLLIKKKTTLKKASSTKKSRPTQEILPAKVTRPGLPAITFRPRLFSKLDEAVKTPVVWIEGPPGAGKTTLISSYIEARKPRCLWYQIDSGDADPATFFHYLGFAIKHAAPRFKNELPHLTPEYLPSLPVFTRRYFEEFCVRLKPPAFLVLDNYQDVGNDVPLHAILADAVSALPEGFQLIIISRSAPRAAFARIRASGMIAHLGWDDLKLTEQESRDVAHLRVPALAECTHAAIYGQTQGWAAGLVLALERGQQINDEYLRSTPQAVFDYFATEIFERMDPMSQRVLLECVFLPNITARQAVELTAVTHASEVFAELNARGYFVLKHVDAGYQLHPLFRKFLLTRSRQDLGSSIFSDAQRKAAHLLRKEGSIEEAVALFIEAQAWDDLSETILAQAKTMLQQGRGQTLQQWLSVVEEAHLEREPWLLYWYAACRMSTDPVEARGYLKKAFEYFRNQKDSGGLYLVWAAIIETFVLSWSDLRPVIAQWVPVFEEVSRIYPDFPSPEVEARVTAGMFSALFWCQPRHPDLEVWAERLCGIVLGNGNAALRVGLGNELVIYYLLKGEFTKSKVVVDTLKRAIRDAQGPITLLFYDVIEATHAWFVADYETCVSAITRGLARGEESGIRLLEGNLLAQGIFGGVSLGQIEAAKYFLERMERVNTFREIDKVHLHYQTAAVAWLQRDLPSALEHGQLALRLSELSGSRLAEAMCRIDLAVTLFDSGKQDVAEQQLACALKMSIGLGYMEFVCGLFQAWFCFETGDQLRGIEKLRHSLDIGAKQKCVNFSRWRPEMMSKICAIALEYEIEQPYVLSLIALRKLTPPDDLDLPLDNWPWPVKIRTLGHLMIERDGVPLSFAGKVQRQPLTLLKLLIAYGGSEVAEARLIDTLWPESDGDAARTNLRSSVHRLRKLIGNDALRVEDGHLSLDPALCWVDAWAVDRLLENTTAFERALALYKGLFLENDAMPEVLIMRDRLRTRMVRRLLDAGESLRQSASWHKAHDLYERGIAIDPWSEASYRGLMHCHYALGEIAEARRVYERCRAALKVRFNLEPSLETQALLRPG